MDQFPPADRHCALVVDDDSFIRMDAAYILAEAGFRTFEAQDADQAIEHLQQHHPVIVLLFTDVQMPGSLDGLALAHRASRDWPHISIVVASGGATPGEGDMPVGARFIIKPFSAEVVHAHLHEILPEKHKPEPLRRAATSRKL